MNSAVKVKTRSTVKEAASYKELSKGVVISVAAMSMVVGAWGILCLGSAFVQLGFGEVVKSYFSAIVGF